MVNVPVVEGEKHRRGRKPVPGVQSTQALVDRHKRVMAPKVGELGAEVTNIEPLDARVPRHLKIPDVVVHEDCEDISQTTPRLAALSSGADPGSSALSRGDHPHRVQRRATPAKKYCAALGTPGPPFLYSLGEPHRRLLVRPGESHPREGSAVPFSEQCFLQVGVTSVAAARHQGKSRSPQHGADQIPPTRRDLVHANGKKSCSLLPRTRSYAVPPLR